MDIAIASAQALPLTAVCVAVALMTPLFATSPDINVGPPQIPRAIAPKVAPPSDEIAAAAIVPLFENPPLKLVTANANALASADAPFAVAAIVPLFENPPLKLAISNSNAVASTDVPFAVATIVPLFVILPLS